MKIEAVRIQNLRSIKDQTVDLGDYTCLVGPNGSGKSTVLCALNIFFGETVDCPTSLTELSEEDFHYRNIGEPITITVTFTDLSEEAKQDLSHYVRQGKLVVSAQAHFDLETRKAAVEQHGQRMVMPAFGPFFEALDGGALVSQLRETYSECRKQVTDLPDVSTKAAMVKSLSTYEEEHLEACDLTWSPAQFYGFSKGKNLLERHVQWVYVPPVKDVSSEQMEARNTALGRLLARTVRSKVDFSGDLNAFRQQWREQYQALLETKQDALDEISSKLAQRIAIWSHPGAGARLEWTQDAEKAVSVAPPLAQIVAIEQEFEGELSRFGHGLQRSCFLALLELLASSEDADQPTLMLACEEPEMYQHPPQARHLSTVLQRLTEGNSQVVVCSHSPYFVSGKGFADIRMARKVDAECVITQATYHAVSSAVARATGKPPMKPEGVLAKIHQSLQPSLSEMFFTPRPIFAEGLEDMAYITTYLHRMDLWDDYRRYACHLIPTFGKSNMIQPLAVAECMGITAFAVFDADGNAPDKDGARKMHADQNQAILALCGISDSDPFPEAVLSGDRVTAWPTTLADVVKAEVGAENWEANCSEASKRYGHAGGLHKNMLHIATALDIAWEAGHKSETLAELCRRIVSFGKTGRAG